MLIKILKAILNTRFKGKKPQKVGCLFLLLLYNYLYYVQGAVNSIANDLFIFVFTMFILLVYFLIRID